MELDDFQLLVDHDAGGYVAVYQQALYLLLHSEHRFGKIRRARLFGFPLRVIEPREVGDQPRRRLLLLIDLVLFVDEREMIGKRTHAFRSTEHQITGRLEPVMHRGNDALLKNRPEINEQIAATDQIETREWRVLREILLGENAHFPDGLNDLITAIAAHKETFQPFRRHSGNRTFRVEATSSPVQ